MVYWAWGFRLAGFENVYSVVDSNELYYKWSDFGPGYYVCTVSFAVGTWAVLVHPDKEKNPTSKEHQFDDKVFLNGLSFVADEQEKFFNIILGVKIFCDVYSCPFEVVNLITVVTML